MKKNPKTVMVVKYKPLKQILEETVLGSDLVAGSIHDRIGAVRERVDQEQVKKFLRSLPSGLVWKAERIAEKNRCSFQDIVAVALTMLVDKDALEIAVRAKRSEAESRELAAAARRLQRTTRRAS